MDIALTLKRIISDRKTHAMWLNGLSYLEYRGFRKIVRSQKTSNMNLEILLHTMEEVRHALFFKRQAIKLGGDTFASYADNTLLGGAATKKYFWDLDQGVSERIKNISEPEASNAAYCIVTWLVEQRALAVYRSYEGLLREREMEISLALLLKEESEHLREMLFASKKILGKYGIDFCALEVVEESAFSELWFAIQKSI